jgi:hypothetical protein
MVGSTTVIDIRMFREMGKSINTDALNLQAKPVWRNSPKICALADGERHLGHTVRIGERWYAFDATHFNENADGFRNLGSFASLVSAREAVELNSCRVIPEYAGAA